MQSEINNSTIQNSQSKLPEGWKWVRLGEVCEINPPRPKDFFRSPEALTTFVPMAVVDEKTGAIIKPEVVSYSEVFKGYTYFEENDVLFAKITPCMQNGKHAIARNLIDGIGFGTTEFHVLRCKNDVIPEWIHYFIRQPCFLQEATAYFTGSVGQRRVPEYFLSEYFIPLPLIEEQRRIATKLQELMQDIERARNACEKQLEAVKALPSAYLREVFESEEAKKWERKRLGDKEFFTILPSGVDYFAGTKEYLSTNSIQEDKITHIESIITYNKRPSRANMQPKFNSVWFAKMKNTKKVYSFTEDNKEEIEKFILSTGFAGILCKNGVYPEYLKQLFLHHPDFNKTKDELSSGATQQAINNESIKLISIPIPDNIKTQYRIATELKEKMAYVEKLRKSIEEQLEAINALPQAILRKAFRGEL